MKTKILELRSAAKDLDKAPKGVVRSYEIWARLVEVHGIGVLRDFKGYHDEKLTGNLKDYRSSRLNRKWRVIYQMKHDGALEIAEVRRVTPHDYRL